MAGVNGPLGDHAMTPAEASERIFEILRELKGPREAAKALAAAHIMVIEAEGVRTEADARARVMQSHSAVLDAWRERNCFPATGNA